MLIIMEKVLASLQYTVFVFLGLMVFLFLHIVTLAVEIAVSFV
jgi:hypothetical protein